LRERREREARIARPLLWGERIVGLCAVLAGLLFCVLASNTSHWLAAAAGALALAVALAAASLWASPGAAWPGDGARKRGRRAV
jgi:hypothetical protein